MRVRAELVGDDELVQTNVRVDTLGLAVDVSEWQKSVDWVKVATACRVGMAKATEGLTYADPWFSAGRVTAMRETVRPALYHFARPDNNAAAPEADHFVRVCEAAGADWLNLADWRWGKDGFVGVLDFEQVPYDAAWAAAWCERYRTLTGVRPLIYGGGYSLNPILSAVAKFAGVWLAAYVNDWRPYWDGAPDQVTFWQWTSSGTVPGVATPCDISYYLQSPA